MNNTNPASLRSKKMAAAFKLAETYKKGAKPKPADFMVLMAPFLNLTPGDTLLYITWLAYTLVQPATHYPHIVLVLDGPDGSGKTTLSDFTNIIFILQLVSPPYSQQFERVSILEDLNTEENMDGFAKAVMEHYFDGAKGLVITGNSINFTDATLAAHTIKLTLAPISDPLPPQECKGVHKDILEALMTAFPVFMDYAQRHTNTFTLSDGNPKREVLAYYEILGKAVSRTLCHNDESPFLLHYLKSQFKKTR